MCGIVGVETTVSESFSWRQGQEIYIFS